MPIGGAKHHRTAKRRRLAFKGFHRGLTMRDFSEIHEKSVENLTVFLGAELDLGFVFVDLAKNAHVSGNVEQFERCKSNANAALTAIRRFQRRIPNLTASRKIRRRRVELERAIFSLE